MLGSILGLPIYGSPHVTGLCTKPQQVPLVAGRLDFAWPTQLISQLGVTKWESRKASELVCRSAGLRVQALGLFFALA